jgi:L-seryl-tRNA(Ser) seleniumtransferase
MTDPRRRLPSVDRLLHDPGLAPVLAAHPRAIVVDAVRTLVGRVRAGRSAPPASWLDAVAELAAERTVASLRPVINATGVVLHTNLGRAPLAPAAIEAMQAVAAGYSTLEYDLASGARGSRHDHCSALLAEVAGGEAAMVVNNAAGALVLALGALARDREILLSRGELIEIGGSFRIPDIVARSGARLREIGTTNRTHLHDYAGAIGAETGAILVVHRSNFEQRGFVTSPPPLEVAALAAERHLPFVHDVGSGLLVDLAAWSLTTEPLVHHATAAPGALVIFSGDKLLGGPQAGCLVGPAALIERCRRDPMARAMRADKLTLAALEATLALYRDPARARAEIPVLRMLTAEAAALRARAESLRARLAGIPGLPTPPELRPGSSTPGGGSFPGAGLPTTLVTLDPGALGADGLALRLRLAARPVIARVQEGRVVLDPRTLQEGDDAGIAGALAGALEADS